MHDKEFTVFLKNWDSKTVEQGSDMIRFSFQRERTIGSLWDTLEQVGKGREMSSGAGAVIITVPLRNTGVMFVIYLVLLCVLYYLTSSFM